MYNQINSQQLRYIRKAKGMSQKDLGDALGVSKVMVSRWENELNPVDPKHHNKICVALQVEIEDLTTQTAAIREESTPYQADINGEWVAETILNLPAEQRKSAITKLFAGASPADRKRVMALLVDLTFE